MKQLFSLSAICAAALLATAAIAAPAPASAVSSLSQSLPQGTLLAREREAGDDRGGHGRDDGKGHRLSDEAPATTLAREKSEGARGKDPHATQGTDEVIAREKSEGARGKDPHATQGTDEVIAREKSEGARG